MFFLDKEKPINPKTTRKFLKEHNEHTAACLREID